MDGASAERGMEATLSAAKRLGEAEFSNRDRQRNEGGMAMAATSKKTADLPPAVWAKIEAAVREIGYGSITIIVQDGRAIQIEINEKIRLT